MAGKAISTPAAGNAETGTAKSARAGRVSLVEKMALKLGVDATKLMGTLKATAFNTRGEGGKEVTDEQMMALLVVANEYNLNPFTRELFAFPAKGGGIVPVVSIDGWVRIINSRPELTSIEFDYSEAGEEDPWTSCTIRRKDRIMPVTIREYMSECVRETGPWKSHPRRMLRHKVLIQCARIAFGFGGVYDPDEAERIAEAMAVEGTVVGKPETAEPRQITQDQARPAEAAVLTSEPQPQEAAAPANPLQALIAKLERAGVPERECARHFGHAAIEDLTATDIQQAHDWLKRVAP